MRFSALKVFSLLLVVLASIPIVFTATVLGAMFLPEFSTNDSGIEEWFLDFGFSEEFVAGHLTFFVMQIPTILVLSCLALLLFALRNRFADRLAIVSFVSLPFVDAFGVGWAYLSTQILTALVLAAIIGAYALARKRIPI